MLPLDILYQRETTFHKRDTIMAPNERTKKIIERNKANKSKKVEEEPIINYTIEYTNGILYVTHPSNIKTPKFVRSKSIKLENSDQTISEYKIYSV